MVFSSAAHNYILTRHYSCSTIDWFVTFAFLSLSMHDRTKTKYHFTKMLQVIIKLKMYCCIFLWFLNNLQTDDPDLTLPF